MKLKMAKNSLFAVLLRSPWWVSFAVVVVFGLASRALLPPEYFVYGVMGAFPFLVIGCIAAYRQLRAPSPKKVENTLQIASAMAGREFNDSLQRAYQARGYEVRRFDGTAADLLLTKNGNTTLVCSKRWKATNHGVEPLRALHQARLARDASQCVYVTLAPTNDNTRRFAEKNGIELLHGSALASLLADVTGRR